MFEIIGFIYEKNIRLQSHLNHYKLFLLSPYNLRKLSGHIDLNSPNNPSAFLHRIPRKLNQIALKDLAYFLTEVSRFLVEAHGLRGC